MIRILQNTPGTVSQSWYEDGAIADPGAVTLTITRADGAVLVSSASTSGSGNAARTYNLTQAHTLTLDTLTLTWVSPTKGTITDSVEVVGGFVFTLAQARATSGLDRQNNDNSYKISTAQILEARTEVERMLEHELGFAMVPRYSLETVSGEGGYSLELKPHVRAVRSVTVDSTAWTSPQVSALAFNPSGFLYSASRWSSGFANITVGYEHGRDILPDGATEAALKLARSLLVSSPGDDRAQSMNTDEQTTTFYVPGANEPFSIPAANRFVQRHSLRVGLA